MTVGVALVGAGVISGEYLRNLTRFPDVRVLGVADVDTARAAAVAAEHEVPVSGDVATVLAVPEVEIVVNLTTPAAHVSVATTALEAGKHVYGEKPLALTPADAAQLVALASARGLRIGNAPDTFLGAGLQATRRAVDAGVIGEPVAAASALQSLGPELWHPSPEFFYQPGAGPLFDMSPYYLTALVALFGPVSRIAATARRARARRVIGSGPRAGIEFDVVVPTHVTALADFAAGPSATATFSFDSAIDRTMIEIIGTDGALSLPDPNTFGGPLRFRHNGDQEWRELPVDTPPATRGIGVLDLARSLRSGVPHRASGELAQHVVDTMTAIVDSAQAGEFRTLRSTVDKPEPLPADWDPFSRSA